MDTVVVVKLRAMTYVCSPTTFMNRSGQSVAPFAKFYQVAPESILIAHDELDMDPGVIRLKTGGGHGGHNGLVISFLISAQTFHRLRIGIGIQALKNVFLVMCLAKRPAVNKTFNGCRIAHALSQVKMLVVDRFHRP